MCYTIKIREIYHKKPLMRIYTYHNQSDIMLKTDIGGGKMASAIERIVESEKLAENQLSSAKKTAEQILRDAKAEAEKLKQEISERSKELRSQKIQEAEEKANSIRTKILEESRKKADVISQIDKGKIERLADMVVDKVVKNGNS